MGIRKIISELLILAERWKQLNFPLSKDGCETTSPAIEHREYSIYSIFNIFNVLWYYISNKLKQAGRGPGHNLVKNDKARGHHTNWLETNGSKMAGQLTSSRPGASAYTHSNTSKWHSHRCPGSFKANHEGQKVGSDPILGTPHPFPKIAGIVLLIAYETTHLYQNWQPHTLGQLLPSEMAHTLSEKCKSEVA